MGKNKEGDFFVAVFQFEIRYNHILNFSQVARTILNPYVRLAQSIKIEKQNTIDERIVFNFETEDYLIIVGWDRILIKGQGDMNKFIEKNSPIETPFLNILEKVKTIDGFGSVINSLFAINFVRPLDIRKEELVEYFIERSINMNVSKMFESTDIAITFENKQSKDEKFISFGPYFGIDDLLKRNVIPVNPENLPENSSVGLLIEYKLFEKSTNIDHQDFVNMYKMALDAAKAVWKSF